MKTAKTYKISVHRFSMYRDYPDKVYEGTLEELIDMFGYQLECGRGYAGERGNSRINTHPKTAKSLVSNLNKAAKNSGAHYQAYFYDLVG